jgi:hypothetical protein
MTEIALNPASNAALAPQSSAAVDLQMWATELTAAYSIGKALASTDFVPASLKTQSGGRPKELEQVAENVAACILAGKALGLDPMNSIQNIFVVHGRPAMYARTMAALVLAAGHEIRRSEATEQQVSYKGRRKGETEWTEVTWSIQRAQKAGYTTNKKYQTDPIAMLTAKCQSEIARVIAPDVLTGIAAVSVEEVELEDLGESPAAAAAPATAPKPLQRKPRAQAPAPVAPAAVTEAPRDLEPVDDEADALAEQADEATGELPEQQPAEQAPAPEEAEQTAPCTPDQQAALQAALKAAGYTARASIMPRVTEFAGRPIASSKQLTETEAIDLTAALWEEADAKAEPAAEPDAA